MTYVWSRNWYSFFCLEEMQSQAMCIFIFYNSIWNVRYTGRHNHICPTLFRNQHKEFLRLFDRVLGVESSLWQERSWKHLKYSIMKLIVISRMERITVLTHGVVCHPLQCFEMSAKVQCINWGCLILNKTGLSTKSIHDFEARS